MNRDSRVEILEHVLADVEHERDRLRDARASWTARLGPLPASAAVLTGIVGALQGKVAWGWAVVAAGIFAVLLAVSVRFAGLKPYRELRRDHQHDFDPSWREEYIGFRRDEVDLEKWLLCKISLEERICGLLGQALDVERTAANIVLGLSLAIVVVLAIGIAL